MGGPNVQPLYRPLLRRMGEGLCTPHPHPNGPWATPDLALRLLGCFQASFSGQSLHVPNILAFLPKKITIFLLLLLFLSIQLPRQSFLKAPAEPGPFLPRCPPSSPIACSYFSCARPPNSAWEEPEWPGCPSQSSSEAGTGFRLLLDKRGSWVRSSEDEQPTAGTPTPTTEAQGGKIWG